MYRSNKTLRYFTYFKIIIGIFLWGLFCQPFVWAQEIQVSQTYFEDNTTNLTIDEIKQQKFIEFENNLNKGYSKSTFWIRIKYLPQPNQPKLFLKVQSTFLDLICLYTENESQPRCQGDTLPFRDREWKGITPMFVLYSAPVNGRVTPVTVYLRIQTTSSMIFYAQVLTQKEVYEQDIHTAVSLGIIAGIITSLLIWGCYRTWVDHSWVAFLFTLYQLTLLLISFTRSGYTAFYFLFDSDKNTDLFYHYLMLIVVLLLVILNRVFIEQFELFKSQKYALNGIILALVLNIIIFEFGYDRLASARNSAFIGTLSPLFIIWALTTVYKTKQAKNYLIVFYITLLMVGSFLGFLRFDIIHIPYFELQALPHLMIVTIPLTFFLMYERTDSLQNRNRTLQIEIALSRQEIEFERQQRMQQSAFMAMLTHELKSPLAVVSMVLGSRQLKQSGKMNQKSFDHVKQATQDMTHLIDQCVHVDKLLEKKQAFPLREVVIPDLISSISHSFLETNRLYITLKDELFYTNETALRVILSNLLDNGLKYSPKNEMVFLEQFKVTRETNEGFLFIISNQVGEAGVPDPTQLFDKYYRSSGAQRQRGTGLGLWLSRELAQRLKGSLICEIKNDRIEFHLWLPFLNKDQTFC